jgi:hypothetical protein
MALSHDEALVVTFSRRAGRERAARRFFAAIDRKRPDVSEQRSIGEKREET